MISHSWSNYSNSTQNTANSLTVGSTNAATTNGTINLNDFLLITIQVQSTGAVDTGAITVTGFTSLFNIWDSSAQRRYAVFYKISGASESGTYAASWTNAPSSASWSLSDFSGNATSSPIDASSSSDNTTYANTIISTSVTPTQTNDMLIFVGMVGGGKNPYGIPAGFTAGFDMNTTSSTSPELIMGYKQLASSSATGTLNGSVTSSDQTCGFQIAVLTASGGPVYDATQGFFSFFAI